MSAATDFESAWSLVIERPVNWGEMDAFGHLNNTVYFRFFEDIRIAHFEELGVLRLMEEEGVGPILAHTEARFRIPLHYPDEVLIGSRIENLQEDRFTMVYGVFSKENQGIAAEGKGRIVYFDYSARSKCAVPDVIRGRIKSA